MTRRIDRGLVAFSWVAAVGLIVVTTSLLGYLAARGGATLGPSLLFGEGPWLASILGRQPVFAGLWPALAGTLVLVVITCVLAIPIGVASGVYLAEYASSRRRATVGLAVDMLAGVPSIVMGLFGFALILFLRRTLAPTANTCLLLAAFCMALLVLPYLVRTTQAALESIPREVRWIGPSLGLTRVQTLRSVLLPAASRGILGGVILSIGRAAEDTAVIMLTGVVASAGMPRGLTEKFEALPFRIYVTAAEYRDSAELARGFGGALTLLMLTTMLFILAAWLQRNLERRWIR